MANWRDRLLPAKFGGVPFFVDSSDFKTGRRNVSHEFPFKDEAFLEDMGRRPRGFSIDGYVIGHDYMTSRDALLTALEAKGPQELIHPYYGTRRVAVGEVRVRETQGEGGWARFSMEFDETPAAPPQPGVTTDGLANVVTSASAFASAAVAEFLAVYSAASLLRDSVSGALRSAAHMIDSVVSRIETEAQSFASIKNGIADLLNSVDFLVTLPSDIVLTFTSMFDDIKSALVSASVVDPIGPLLKIYGFDAGVRPPATTPERAIEQANFDGTQRLIQRLALAQAATIATAQAFPSYEEAVRVRTTITDLLDEQGEVAADDVYPTLQQLLADLVRSVPGENLDLPHLITYTPAVTLPSLVLSYQLYGDLDGEADIIARNSIANPGFVTGGVELEVLSRDT